MREEQQRTRLSQLEEIALRLRPFRRATSLADYFLYWLPVKAKPLPVQQRIWLDSFLSRLSAHLTAKRGLRAEVFLEYKTIYPDLMDLFLDLSLELLPLLGFGMKPGVPLPRIPTLEDTKLLGEGKPFNFGDYIGDFVFWFLGKDERRERESFFGYGGMTIMYLPPDPAIAAKKLPISPRLREHPVFRELFAQIDPDKVVARGKSLTDQWLKLSMDLYGRDLPKSPQMKGIRFIVPLLKSADFTRDAQERDKLSQMCEVYVRESSEDGGILLGSKTDFTEPLVQILDEMSEAGMEYPEG
jgi:hypothetical protein